VVLGILFNHVPTSSFVRRSISPRIIVHDLTRESSYNVAASCRPALPAASLQKKHFTSSCFDSVLDGRERFRVCLRSAASSTSLVPIFRCLFSALSNLVLLYLSLQVLWYRAFLVLNAASTPLPSSSRLKRKDLESNPRSLNLLRYPARML